jgi:hypothetical protein
MTTSCACAHADTSRPSCSREPKPTIQVTDFHKTPDGELIQTVNGWILELDNAAAGSARHAFGISSTQASHEDCQVPENASFGRRNTMQRQRIRRI